MRWSKAQRPPVDVCPEKYCFFWVRPGGRANMSDHPHPSLEEALESPDGWVDFPNGGCACSLGTCTRHNAADGDHDWYEPCEPALRADDLPWFYFTASPKKLTPEFRERFLVESRALWGVDDDA